MEITKRILILGITLMLFIPFSVMAFHAPDVSISPQESMISQEKEMNLKVMNEQGDDINKITLVIPNNEDGPLFHLKEVTSPAGWTYQVRYKVEATYPYKITWLTEGTGIEKGKSMDLGFTVGNPSELGDYVWVWETKDSDGQLVSGNLTTSVISKEIDNFEITEEPKSIKAGESFSIWVNAMNNLGEIKDDYTGTIYFDSTDDKALLPEKYTFETEDKGSKMFEIEFRSHGNQTISISDKENNISKTSDNIFIDLAGLSSISISPTNPEAEVGETVTFHSFMTDVYGNKIDVTSEADFSIEEKAGGNFTENTYTTENEGSWVLKAEYNGLTAATLLEVVPRTEINETEPEINETVNETEPKENETEKSMKLIYPVSIEAEVGKEIAFNVTVENTRKDNLTEVELVFQGSIPEENIEVNPNTADIRYNSSKKYLVVISVPENTTGSLVSPFIANSTRGISANGTLFMSVSEGPGVTPSEINYNGIIVFIVIGLALIISVYTFLRRKKKEEKPSKKSE